MTSIAVPELDQQTREALGVDCEAGKCRNEADWALSVLCPRCDATRTYLICAEHRRAAWRYLRGRLRHKACSWAGSSDQCVISEVPL